MSKITLTVFFDDPFWVGVFERVTDGRLSVSKVTFGAEPKDYEVYAFVLERFCQLPFSPAVAAEQKQTSVNPKRRQREARKQVNRSGVGTRSQQALSAQREEQKIQRKQMDKQQRETEKLRQFAQKQEKKKEKHRGH